MLNSYSLLSLIGSCCWVSASCRYPPKTSVAAHNRIHESLDFWSRPCPSHFDLQGGSWVNCNPPTELAIQVFMVRFLSFLEFVFSHYIVSLSVAGSTDLGCLTQMFLTCLDALGLNLERLKKWDEFVGYWWALFTLLHAVRKWVITPVISRVSSVSPVMTGVLTRLLTKRVTHWEA